MDGLLLAALLLLGIAGWSWWRSRSARDRREQLLTTETHAVATLRELAAAAADAAGPGAFVQTVEVEGRVSAGPGGPLTSELTGTECVWHMHKVTRRYRDVDRGQDGRRRERTREEVVTRSRTTDPFVVTDATGQITVLPQVNVSHARKSHSRFVPSDRHEDRPRLRVGSFELDLPSTRDRDDTLGYEYEEWVLPADTRVFVRGEATDAGGELVVKDPTTGGSERMLISTRSEAELVDGARDAERRSRLVALGSGALGVVAGAAGLVRTLL